MVATYISAMVGFVGGPSMWMDDDWRPIVGTSVKHPPCTSATESPRGTASSLYVVETSYERVPVMPVVG